MRPPHPSQFVLAGAAAALIASCSAATLPVATAPHGPGAGSHVRLLDPTVPRAGTPAHTPPALLVHVDRASDPKRKLQGDDGMHLTEILRRAIADGKYETAWPGGLPRAAELTATGARAYIVAATVNNVEIERSATRASILCTVGIRISPWYGVDGGEHWEVSNAATATGTARSSTGLRDELIRLGVRDCVLDVGTAVVTQQILPFLETRATP